jgi:hypothetical protein
LEPFGLGVGEEDGRPVALSSWWCFRAVRGIVRVPVLVDADRPVVPASL